MLAFLCCCGRTGALHSFLRVVTRGCTAPLPIVTQCLSFKITAIIQHANCHRHIRNIIARTVP